MASSSPAPAGPLSRVAERIRRRFDSSLRAYEEDLADPEPEGIEFRSLGPETGICSEPARLRDIDSAWIARLASRAVLARARSLCAEGRVHVTEEASDALAGRMEDRANSATYVAIHGGKLVTDCSCRRMAASEPGGLCAHVLALLLTAAARNAHERGDGPDGEAWLCAITRRPISPDRAYYRCAACMMLYSAEGWDMVRRQDRGRCAACRSRSTIRLVGSGEAS